MDKVDYIARNKLDEVVIKQPKIFNNIRESVSGSSVSSVTFTNSTEEDILLDSIYVQYTPIDSYNPYVDFKDSANVQYSRLIVYMSNYSSAIRFGNIIFPNPYLLKAGHKVSLQAPSSKTSIYLMIHYRK